MWTIWNLLTKIIKTNSEYKKAIERYYSFHQLPNYDKLLRSKYLRGLKCSECQQYYMKEIAPLLFPFTIGSSISLIIKIGPGCTHRDGVVGGLRKDLKRNKCEMIRKSNGY